MRIGIFDSGLGGLVIAKTIFQTLPNYDYVYVGDTKNLPYGEKSREEIFNRSRSAVEFLFKQDCDLVIIACNTASAVALRKIQRKILPKKFPQRRVLGVVIPTLETANVLSYGQIFGVLATSATVKTHIYAKELKKINPLARVIEVPAPNLVKFIEENSLPKAENELKLYIRPLLHAKVNALILGCTHYPILKKLAKKIVGKNVKVLSQDEIIPGKLKHYLKRHPEITNKLSRQGTKTFFVTKNSLGFAKMAKKLFGKNIQLQLVKI